MATFLKLLAQTLFGYEFKSLELNQLHPPGKGSLGEGDLFGGEGVVAILSKYVNGVCIPSLRLKALKMWPQPIYPKNIAPPPPPMTPPAVEWGLGDLTSKIKICTHVGFTHQV